MPATPLEFDASILTQLACPACYGELRAEASRLVCIECRRKYPIVNGIPALIIERADSTK